MTYSSSRGTGACLAPAPLTPEDLVNPAGRTQWGPHPPPAVRTHPPSTRAHPPHPQRRTQRGPPPLRRHLVPSPLWAPSLATLAVSPGRVDEALLSSGVPRASSWAPRHGPPQGGRHTQCVRRYPVRRLVGTGRRRRSPPSCHHAPTAASATRWPATDPALRRSVPLEVSPTHLMLPRIHPPCPLI